MARKKIEIDWEFVDEKLANFWEGTEVVAHLGINYATLERRIKEVYKVDFVEYKRQKRAKGEAVLRELQLRTAMLGNVTMQIWLGKQYLGQKEKTDYTTKGQSLSTVEINVSSQENAKELKDFLQDASKLN